MDEDIFWGERIPQEAEALICLVEAEVYLGKAMLDNSIELYLKAFEFSEKVIEYLPRSAIAHFISGFAQLKAKGDMEYVNKNMNSSNRLSQKRLMNWRKNLKKKLKEPKVS